MRLRTNANIPPMNAVSELLRPALEGVAALGPWGSAAFVLLYVAAKLGEDR